MADYTDAYGLWRVIADDYQPGTNWFMWDAEIQGITLLRFIFFTNWARWTNPYDGYRSYLQIKRIYRDDAGVFSVEMPRQRVYVNENDQLITLAETSEFRDISWGLQRLSTRRKFFKNATWIEDHPTMDLKFLCRIEGFLG